MKTSTLVATLGLFAGVMSAEPASAVTVNFVDADNFTDFTNSYAFPDRGRSGFAETLSKFIAERVDDKLAPGWKLMVVITDVDMAGEFEPWRGPQGDDIRIVKDLYPPRIDLSFRVVNENGELITEGDRKLRDMGFMFTGRALNNDPLKYEKELLSRWISREFGRDFGRKART